MNSLDWIALKLQFPNGRECDGTSIASIRPSRQWKTLVESTGIPTPSKYPEASGSSKCSC